MRKGGKKITGKRKRTERQRTERRRRRTGRIQSRPVLRADLYRWMTYRETLVLASLTGRQIALLLEGYVRHLRKWVVRNSAVLWPGGLAVEVREKGSEIITLRRKSDGAEIRPRARYRVWLTDFIWNGGGGGLAPKALIARVQRITGLPSSNQQGGFSLRETVFAMLNDPDFQVPPECARWLENPPEKGPTQRSINEI